MTQTTIEKIKKGDAFQLSEKGRLMIAEGYNRFSKKYEYVAYSGSISDFKAKKKGTKVFID